MREKRIMADTENCKLEYRSVIKFLILEGNSPQDIHHRMITVYNDDAPSYATVKRWAIEFKSGRKSLGDDPRSGRPASSVNKENIEAVKALIHKDRRIKFREIHALTGLADPQIKEIIHEHLNMSKLSARWIPRILTKENKRLRLETSDRILELYNADPENFLACCVTGDETWIHHFDPESKEESMMWTASGQAPPVKARRLKSAGKIMLTVFWDAAGALLLDFLPHKETVNAVYYADLLSRLREAIKEKRRGMLTRGVMLLHDNAPVHTAHNAQAALKTLHFTQLEHPPYSPDLAPSDFHLFPHLKKHLRGTHYSTDDALKKAVEKWFNSQPVSFFKSGIEALSARCLKCILLDGDYVEKI